MIPTSGLSIYDASAGSGKTFTLVKKYLTQLLSSPSDDGYKQLLAITFTNKAVAEMKSRIIDQLVYFSKEESMSVPSPMATQLMEETGLEPAQLHQRSQRILKHLLHHYAGFAVETIDGFNHRLIKTFAKDLKLPAHFEVSLDTLKLLAEAVDQLIARAGEDAEITQVLLEYALQKTDEDKSWDISHDLLEISQLLLDENHRKQLDGLKGRTLKDFQAFKTQLLQDHKLLGEAITKTAQQQLDRFHSLGLDDSHFSGKHLYRFFEKVAAGNFNVNWDTAWRNNVGEKPLYPSRVSSGEAEIIDGLVPEIEQSLQQIETQIPRLWLMDNILGNLVPLSVLHLIRQELDTIKEEQRILPISEFNSLIHAQIKDQPAPFIYERLGERYRHYFIDEFQDTSQLQWSNMIPLIDNALSQYDGDGNPGSLLLVGDAKQSIYRWRGGLPEQFMSLKNEATPFAVDQKQLYNLNTNYRSLDQIVTFNNDLFRYLSRFFELPAYEALYKTGSQQKTNNQPGGYVQIEFIPKETTEEQPYATKVLQTIKGILETGYRKQDICILTRTNRHGIELSQFLMEEGLEVLSPDALLLKNASSVKFLIHTLTLSLYPENHEVKMQWLEYLHAHLQSNMDLHSFLDQFLKAPFEAINSGENALETNFEMQQLMGGTLYQSCEYIIHSFQLPSDGFLFGFMNLVHEFTQQPGADLHSFLEYWELKKEVSSLPAAEGMDAIQVMTIHKAKGLEFPVVLFPYANVSLYNEIQPKVWFPWPSTDLGFEQVLINFKKEVSQYGAVGAQLYQERRETLLLDQLNLLYVCCTRAVEQLYILSEEVAPYRDQPKGFSDLLRAFLESDNTYRQEQLVYPFGKPPKDRDGNQSSPATFEPLSYRTSLLSDQKLRVASAEASLWDTEAAVAISDGNLIHDTMAQIQFAEDVAAVFEQMELRHIIPEEPLKQLRATVQRIVDHPELQSLYRAHEDTVVNERDIITASGEVIRPDRLQFQGNKVQIIDYKTGAENSRYHHQLERYATALNEMGYQVTEKIIIYVQTDTIVINKL